MLSRTHVLTTALGVVLVPLTLAAPVAAQGTTPATDASRVVQHVTDRKSGLDIRLTRADGAVIVEVADKSVSVKKEMKLGKSTTTIASGSDRLGFVIEASAMTVVDQGKVVHFEALSPEARDREVARITHSRAIADARALLGRLDLQPLSVTGNSLLLTDMLIGTLSGDDTAAAAYRQKVREAMAQPHVVTAGFQKGSGPKACWDSYATDAIKYADEYAACQAGCRWWQFTCVWGCDAIYAAEAETAWAWLMACSGGSFISS